MERPSNAHLDLDYIIMNALDRYNLKWAEDGRNIEDVSFSEYLMISCHDKGDIVRGQIHAVDLRISAPDLVLYTCRSARSPSV